MRSQSRSASSTSWVTRTTVVPASRTRRTTSQVRRRPTGSRFWVSSSRNTSRGPADEREGDEQALALAAGEGAERPAPEAARAATPRPARRAAGARDGARRTAAGPRRPACGRAGRRPGAGRRSAGAAGRRHVPGRGRAPRPSRRRRRPEALEDLDRGGLAGAVRAEQPEQLALLDGEGDAVEDRRRAVALLAGPGPRRPGRSSGRSVGRSGAACVVVVMARSCAPAAPARIGPRALRRAPPLGGARRSRGRRRTRWRRPGRARRAWRRSHRRGS